MSAARVHEFGGIGLRVRLGSGNRGQPAFSMIADCRAEGDNFWGCAEAFGRQSDERDAM